MVWFRLQYEIDVGYFPRGLFYKIKKKKKKNIEDHLFNIYIC